jgi:hypothetical protein
LIAEVAEIIDAEANGKDQPRVVTLTDDAKNEEGSFVLLDSDAEEEEEDKNEREKHKKDLKNVNLVLEAINGKIQGAVVPPKHNIDQAEAKALTFKQIQQQFAMNTFNEKSAKLIAEAINQGISRISKTCSTSLMSKRNLFRPKSSASHQNRPFSLQVQLLTQ